MAVPSGELKQSKEQEELPISGFIQACSKGCYEIVKHLLEENPSLVNTSDQYGRTPLWFAAAAERWNIVKYLTNKGAKGFDISPAEGPDRGKTPLWFATRASVTDGDWGLVSDWIRNGARGFDTSPAEGPDEGKTVLWGAAYAEQWELVEAMIEKGARNFDACPAAENDKDRGKTVLWKVAAWPNKQWGLVKVMIEKGAKNFDTCPLAKGDGNQGVTVLWWAAYAQQWELVEAMIKEGAKNFDTWPMAEGANNRGKTVLWWAARDNKWKLVKVMIEKGAKNFDTCPITKGDGNQGVTVLWVASIHDQWDLVERMIALGAKDFDACPLAENSMNRGITVLWQAALSDRWDLVERMIALGARNFDTCPIAEVNNGGRTVLWWTAWARKWKLVKVMIENGARNFDACPAVEGDEDDEAGKDMTLLWLAASDDQWNLVQTMIKLGAKNFNACPAKGSDRDKSVLWWATVAKEWNLAKYIINNGAKGFDIAPVGGPDRGKTALWWTAHAGKWELLRFMIERGAKNLDPCPSPLLSYKTSLWYTMNNALFRLLLTKGASFQVVLNTHLVHGGAYDTNERLIQMTFSAAEGLFVLARAFYAREEEQQYLKLCLAELGPALNGRMNRKTALQVAIEKGTEPMIEALILAGADLSLSEDASKMLTEEFGKLQIALKVELDGLLKLNNDRRESKEEAESEKLQESFKTEINKIEEKIKRILELEKLAQIFLKLQTLRSELDGLASNTRETKEEVEEQELKESVEARIKKIEKLAGELLEQGQTLKQLLHKDTFYNQLGQLLHEGVEKGWIPGEMAREAFSKVSKKTPELYQEACAQYIHYSTVAPKKEQENESLKAPAEPTSLDEEEEIDKKFSREKKLAQEQISKGVRALIGMPSPNANLPLLGASVIKAIFGDHTEETGGEFLGLSKEESDLGGALTKILQRAREKVDEGFSKVKELRQANDKQSDFSSLSSSSSSSSRKEPVPSETEITSENSKKRPRSVETAEGQPERKTNQEWELVQSTLQSAEIRPQLPITASTLNQEPPVNNSSISMGSLAEKIGESNDLSSSSVHFFYKPYKQHNKHYRDNRPTPYSSKKKPRKEKS